MLTPQSATEPVDLRPGRRRTHRPHRRAHVRQQPEHNVESSNPSAPESRSRCIPAVAAATRTPARGRSTAVVIPLIKNTAVREATLQLEHHERARAVVEAQRHCQTAQTAQTPWKPCSARAAQEPSIIDWAGQQPFSRSTPVTQPLLAGWKTVEYAAIRALEHVAQKKPRHDPPGNDNSTPDHQSADPEPTHRQLQEQFDTVCNS